ncbi:MAG: hypothetical protein ACI8W8_003960 [Rhodothermales bacterium]|jgi:hypothetical protein
MDRGSTPQQNAIPEEGFKMKTTATLILTMLTVLGLHAGHDPISQLERELAQAGRDLDIARHSVNSLAAEERSTRSCLNTANSQLAAADRENDAIESSLRRTHKALNGLRADANALQARKNSLERRLAQAPPPVVCPTSRYSHWHHRPVDPNAGLRAELASVNRDLRCVQDDIGRLEREDGQLHARKPAVLARMEQSKRIALGHRKTLDRVVCDLRNATRDRDQQQARVKHLQRDLEVARCHRPQPQPRPVVVYEERHEHRGHGHGSHGRSDRRDRHSRDAHVARDIGAIFGLFAHLASH